MKEIDQVMHAAASWTQRAVVATVVEVQGSSYRRQGALMLVGEDGSLVGAVSGGCIEKEIVRRSTTVFASGKPVVIEYDGRYTLGCNGTILILIEPFAPVAREMMFARYFKAFKAREPWQIVSYYSDSLTGSSLHFGTTEAYPLSDEAAKTTGCEAVSNRSMSVSVSPSRQLHIIGSETDASILATLGVRLGYLVTVIGHPRNPDLRIESDDIRKQIVAPEAMHQSIAIDAETAVVLMTHSYSRDLGYLSHLLNGPPVTYLGLVGPKRRTEELLSDLVDNGQEIPTWLDDSLHAPAGLDIGGELPPEVSIAVLAEIQMIFSGYQGGKLSEKSGPIHHDRVQR